jgi:hypothetical protein
MAYVTREDNFRKLLQHHQDPKETKGLQDRAILYFPFKEDGCCLYGPEETT